MIIVPDPGFRNDIAADNSLIRKNPDGDSSGRYTTIAWNKVTADELSRYKRHAMPGLEELLTKALMEIFSAGCTLDSCRCHPSGSVAGALAETLDAAMAKLDEAQELLLATTGLSIEDLHARYTTGSGAETHFS